jgi:hypothetical protein
VIRPVICPVQKPIDLVELRSLMHRIRHILRNPRPAAALNNLAGLPRTGSLNLADAASQWFVGLLSKHFRCWQRTASAPFLGSAESK